MPKKLVDAGNQLLRTFGIGAGWDLLVIQTLKVCANLGRLHCAVYVSTAFLSAGIATPAPAPDGKNETQDFL